MTATLSIQQYPFVKDAKAVLSKLNITFETIDTTNAYDEILKAACADILTAVTRKKLDQRIVINQIEKSTFEREVAKFYLSLMIIKTSTILTKQFIRFYINKFKLTVDHYVNKIGGAELNVLPYYLILFKEFGLEWKLIRQGDTHFIKCHVLNYLDMETLIDNHDPPNYQLLKIVNCSLYGGYVYFHFKDYGDFQNMLNKLLEERIRKLVTNIEENIECKKIEKCRSQLTKYMQDKEGLSYQPNPKILEYGEVTNQQLLSNEQVVQVFNDFIGGERYLNILETKLPPCIWVMMDQIRRKEPLKHGQNILLCTYLAAKGYTEEQITQVFKKTVNYDPNVARYNIKYVLRKKIKPMNCRNLLPENLCNKHLDRTKQCEVITNPLSYKEVVTNG